MHHTYALMPSLIFLLLVPFNISFVHGHSQSKNQSKPTNNTRTLITMLVIVLKVINIPKLGVDGGD